LKLPVGSPYGLTFDPIGNMYYTDHSAIMMYSIDGRLHTIAGRVDTPGDRDGHGTLEARLAAPYMLLWSHLMNRLWVVEHEGAVRWITFPTHCKPYNLPYLSL
jgi:hypothetical protein